MPVAWLSSTMTRASCLSASAITSFARAMGAFRWLRDHYQTIRVASGAILVALGLLLFFDRFWWLNVAANRVKDAVGLG